MPRANKQARAAYDREYKSRPEVRARDARAAKARYLAGGGVKKREYDRRRREDPAFREKRKEYARNRKRTHWANMVLPQLRNRARKLGVPFDLVVADLTLPAACPVFGTPLVIGTGKQSNNSPSVDRIVPSKGYVRGNVAVVSLRANSLKREATAAELRLLADFYTALEG